MLSPIKKISALLLVVCLLLANIASAGATGTVSLIIAGPNGTTSYASAEYAQVITLDKGGNYTLSSSTSDSEVYFSIVVDAPGEEVAINLNGVSIHAKQSSAPGKSAILCSAASKVTISAAANTENILRGSCGGSGIWVASSCGDVVLSGTGKITAYGSSGSDNASGTGGYGANTTYAPGIYKASSNKQLIIESGTIEAIGSEKAPGIGGSLLATRGAQGGTSSSSASDTSNIVFKGGNVTARAFVTDDFNAFANSAKPLGVADDDSSCSNITIAPSSGVTITAGFYLNKYTGQVYPLERVHWSDTFSQNTSTDITNNIGGKLFVLTSTGSAIKPEEYTITATADPASGGTVTGAGNYVHGATVTLSAAANEGYTFAGWYEGANRVGDEATLTFAASASHALTARFSQNTYTITATADPTNGGTITGTGDYVHGENVHLTATANEDYIFDGWYENGQQISTNEKLMFVAERSGNYVARFSSTGVANVPSSGGDTPNVPKTGDNTPLNILLFLLLISMVGVFNFYNRKGYSKHV